MPNSQLNDKYFKVPDNVFNQINRRLSAINPDTEQAKGLKRAKDIVADRKISYSQMKRLKNYFDTYKGDGNDEEFKLIGGKVTRMWVDKTLGSNRDSILQSKKAKMDGGLENQFLKTHEKDNDNTNLSRANGGMIDIAKSSKSKNIMANSAIYQENYKKEIDSMKYLIEYMDKSKNK
jgi:hypothetical protein